MKIIVVAAVLLAACGGTKAVEPPPPPPPVVTHGTVVFTLDNRNCQSYTTAEYNIDSTTVGTEAIVPGQASKTYTAVSGKRSAIARLTRPGTTSALWTFRAQVNVPVDGGGAANLSC